MLQGVRLTDFASIYRSKYNETLSAFGFGNVLDLLSSLTDVLTLKQSSSGIFYAYPKNGQAKSAKPKNTTPTTSSSSKPRVVSEEIIKSLKHCIGKYPDGIEVTDFLTTYRASENSNFEFSNYGCQSMMQFCTIFSDIFKVEKKSPDPRHDWVLFPAQTEVQPSKNIKDGKSIKLLKYSIILHLILLLSGQPENLLSPDAIKNLKKLVLQYPNGINIVKCAELYEERYGQPLSVQRHQSIPLSEVFLSLNFIEIVTKPHPINPITNIKLVRAKAEFLARYQVEKAQERMKNSLQTKKITKVEPNTNVITVTNLAETVTMEDLETLFSHCGRVSLVKPKGENEYQIVMEDKKNAVKAIKAFDQQALDGQKLHCSLTPDAEIEAETMKSAQEQKRIGKIYQMKLPESVKVGALIDVCVAEVFHPHKLYVQLKENYAALNDLMDDLDDFYKAGPGISKKYRLSNDHCYEIGRCCAILYCDMWHRK